jgi:acetyltransferase-like isoleucine patch superfamily enzyme
MYPIIRICLLKARVLVTQPVFLLKKSRVPLSCRMSRDVTLSGSRIGRYCCIGPGCVFNNLDLGNYCSVAPHVQIGGMEHAWRSGSTSPFLSDRHVHNRRTTIGEDVWIGASAIIRQGVSIGRGSIVGAGSLVLHDIPPYAMAVGNPARILKKRFPDETIEQIERTRYWECPPREAFRRLQTVRFPVSSESSPGR